MAMFWACAASGSERRQPASSDVRAAREVFFMSVGLSGGMRVEAEAGGSRAAASGARWGSGVVRRAGVDGQGVDAARHQSVQGIIYEAMPRHP